MNDAQAILDRGQRKRLRTLQEIQQIIQQDLDWIWRRERILHSQRRLRARKTGSKHRLYGIPVTQVILDDPHHG